MDYAAFLFETAAPLKTRTFRKLWHVGSMTATDKRADSYEGAGLSVSLHPNAWRRIARGFVGGDTYEMTKPGNVFLDAHKVGKRQEAQIRQWAIENGYAEAKAQYQVSWYDEEMDGRVAFVFDTREEAEAESDPEYNEDIIIKEIPTGMTGTQKLADRCMQTRIDTSPLDLILTVYAEDVMGVDGVWFNDLHDPSRLSAPRGVIFQSKLASWTAEKISYDPDENLDESLTEARQPRLTKILKTAVVKWAKNNKVWPLHQSYIDELLALPVRPTQPITLYRGLLFSDAHNNFAQAVETGNHTLSISWGRPSSWTTEQYVADGFARNANVGDDNFMGQIMSQNRWKDSEIDGEFGVVLQITAQPDQIICGLDYLELDNAFNHEHEFILKGGPMEVTIVQAFDRNGAIAL
jgi:hypothetical protein